MTMLRGIKVVEAASYVSGPFAGQCLAQLGAEVTKVEPPSGDPARRFGLRHRGLSALFVNVNQGKQSVVLDLKDERDLATMRGLLAGADVFLQNWRPGVAESLGLGADELRSRHPTLVYASVTGFGASGPAADQPVFDSSIQALSGLAVYESGGTEPSLVRSMIADKTTALMVVQAVLAALVARARTGQGARIDVAMLDAMAYVNFPDMAQDRTFLGAGRVDLKRGAPNVVPTRDGHLVVTPVSGRQLGAAVTAVGHPEWRDDLKAAGDPSELMDVLVDRLSRVTPSRTTAEWEKVFASHDVPATPLLSLDEHFSDERTAHSRLYSTGSSPVGPVRRIRYPALVDLHPLPAASPAPPLADPP